MNLFSDSSVCSAQSPITSLIRWLLQDFLASSCVLPVLVLSEVSWRSRD